MSQIEVSTQEARVRTSAQWWSEVRLDEERFVLWLRKQYHGEMLAWERVRKFANEFAPVGNRWRLPLLLIATQEMKHAAWIAELLLNRHLEPEILSDKPERYWSKALDGVSSFEGLAAQAAWAELMRLERIRVIANDTEAPADVRQVFLQILVDEQFHAKAFTELAGDEAMKEAFSRHEAGMAAIGVAMETEEGHAPLIPDLAVGGD